MELALIIGLGRLLFDVAKWIQGDVIDAENNPSLDAGKKKHEYVKQNVHRKITDAVNIDLRDEIKRLPQDKIDKIKEEAAKQVNRSIEEAVKTLNEKGYFARG